jgi:alkaline phosphatase D
MATGQELRAVQVWCADFIGSDETGPASCCSKDDDIALGWCTKASSRSDSRFGAACDPTNSTFGATNWALNAQGELRVAVGNSAKDAKDESGFCEVLGKVPNAAISKQCTGVHKRGAADAASAAKLMQYCLLAPAVTILCGQTEASHGLTCVQAQREWLRAQIETIRAPITLVASGSVLFGAPSRTNSPQDDPPYTGYCSGDDWDCYRPAQQNLIAELSRIPGCVVVITGDYHAADIKRVMPGERAPYVRHYKTQVRASHHARACPHSPACSRCAGHATLHTAVL